MLSQLTHPVNPRTQTAGLVVTLRLPEDPTTSVLVLEAGRVNLSDDSISTVFRSHYCAQHYDTGTCAREVD